MIAEKQTKSNIGVGVGFVVAVIGRVLAGQGTASQNQGIIILGAILSLAGSAIFIWGCVNYAQGKGYSPWLGLLGLLSCIGLIVLVILPDKNKDGGPPAGYGGGYVPPQTGVWPPPPGSTPPSFGQPPASPDADSPPPRKSLGGDDL